MAKKPNRERTDSQVKLNQTKREANCVSTEPAFQKKTWSGTAVEIAEVFLAKNQSQKTKKKKEKRSAKRREEKEKRREGRVPQLSWTCNSAMTLT